MRRRRLEWPDGLAIETCWPTRMSAESEAALHDLARAAERYLGACESLTFYEMPH
jgi:hypothetical protein